MRCRVHDIVVYEENEREIKLKWYAIGRQKSDVCMFTFLLLAFGTRLSVLILIKSLMEISSVILWIFRSLIVIIMWINPLRALYKFFWEFLLIADLCFASWWAVIGVQVLDLALVDEESNSCLGVCFNYSETSLLWHPKGPL